MYVYSDLIPTILGSIWLEQVEIKRNFQIVWLNPKIFKNFEFLAKSAILGKIWPFLQHLVDQVGNTKLITRRLPLSSLKKFDSWEDSWALMTGVTSILSVENADILSQKLIFWVHNPAVVNCKLQTCSLMSFHIKFNSF